MIDSIEFRLMSPEMIESLAATEILRADLYDNDGFPAEGGVMDPRLGVIDPGLRCRTCGQNIGKCFGHFGYIGLIRPVVHVLYNKIIYKLLKSICFKCSRALNTIASKKCQHCSEEQPKWRFEKPYSYMENEKAVTPIEIRRRFEEIPDDDLAKLEFNGGRPEWLILTLFPVPPVISRPSITLDTGERSEDDLTHKLVDIIRINQRLKENIEIGAPDFIIEDLWELLQYHSATFFNNSLSGIPAARHRSGRPLKTLADRLKSKEGRFRHNLSGKRVNFSARTVISPDPYISINDVGIPLEIAKDLTIPVAVQKHNIDEIKKLVKNVPFWPSVNYLIRPDGRKKKITADNKDEILEEVAPGYSVERHLVNGDVVLFNRQPSLHRMSIMAHKVRVTPWRTFTMNTPVCPPYNADFDGDEMNLHVLQTDEARAEAEILMDATKHIRSPRFGGPIIGCEQDHISGLFMLTMDETTLTKQQAFQILHDCGLDVELPNKKTFTGKEVFSYILPKDINMEYKAKYARNAMVIIEKGKLKSGIIDKASVGKENGKLVDRIDRFYGSKRVHKFLDRAAMLGIKWLEMSGFTIGINDYDLGEKADFEIAKTIAKSLKETDILINKLDKKALDTLPGRTLKESFEAYTLRVLGKTSETVGNIIADNVRMNCAIIMAKAGARGSLTHVTQLSGLVGQEMVLGERIHRGYEGRTLPHYQVGDMSPGAHGFVAHGFKHGLTPFEFFFDVLSGREGLMDKSLRTRHSGYLERRLMNALQDLKVEYDGTVRDNNKTIIQFNVGEDGIDPAKSDWGKLDIKDILNVVG
jgi:DNA-directed RNA polymerase subunit A'